MKGHILILAMTCISAANCAEKPALVFTENLGQVRDQNGAQRSDILFGGSTGNLYFHIRKTGISYQLLEKQSTHAERPGKFDRQLVDGKTSVSRVDIEWLGASSPEPFKFNPLSGHSNYIREFGDDVMHVKSFSEVFLKNVYAGIDVHYYGSDNKLKYDFILKPGANPENVQMRVTGADSLFVNKEGELVIITPLGTISEGVPFAVQNGREVTCRWQLHGKVATFSIAEYEASDTLIIDPLTRVWGTYYGGNANDWFYQSATDSIGNVFCAGFSASGTGTIIATTGTHQQTLAGMTDAMLVKFDKNGVRIWATYLGGSAEDFAFGCALDKSANIFVCGTTESTGLSTPLAHQLSYMGKMDAFMAKFDSSGSRFWLTYYGGPDEEYLQPVCATDLLGNVFMVGLTESDNLITTQSAYQKIRYGSSDAFIAKFNAAGVLLWDTYFGGPDEEVARGCTTDLNGNIIVAGLTGSTYGIASLGSHQFNSGGGMDAFLVKFSPTGSRLWSTFYGGSGEDDGFNCVTGSNGEIFLVGNTESTSGISTPGTYQQSFAGGAFDGMIVKFNSLGVRQWGAYYGGDGYDIIYACCTDQSGSLFVCGSTQSAGGTNIATPATHQPANGGDWDAFLAKFDASGNRQWATYYGGTEIDVSTSCIVDNKYSVYLVGQSTSTLANVISTTGGHQPSNNGLWDGFLVKFDDCSVVNLVVKSNNNPLCIGSTATLTAFGANSYTWSGPVAASGNFVVTTPSASSVYSVEGTAGHCVVSSSFSLQVSPCAGIAMNALDGFSAFPNPVDRELIVMAPSDCRYEIIEVSGLAVMAGSFITGRNTVTAPLMSGIYILRTDTGYNHKFVVE